MALEFKKVMQLFSDNLLYDVYFILPYRCLKLWDKVQNMIIVG